MAKSTAESRRYASGLLDRLKELDIQTRNAYYEMGSILSAFRNNKLYELIGYNSFSEMVEEELGFTTTTATRYVTTYDHLRRLKYNKAESLRLMAEVGFTHVANVIPTLKEKVGHRAIRARAKQIEKVQINFGFDAKDALLVRRALEEFGAEYKDDGRCMNATESFLEMARWCLGEDDEKVA